MFHLLRCLFKYHTVDRNRVRENGGDFFGPCRGCHKPMFRTSGGWRLEMPGDRLSPADLAC
jgi:hypothetical protein